MRNLHLNVFAAILAIGLILGGSALEAFPQETTSSNGSQRDPLAELEAWNKIKQSAVASDYYAFLKKFPNGALAARARERMNTLGDPVWNELKKSRDPFKYRDYIKANPDSPFLDQAQARFEVLLRDAIEWEKAKASQDFLTIKSFILDNPKSEFIEDAVKTIEPYLWRNITETGDLDSMLLYQKLFEGSEREKEVAGLLKEKCYPSCRNPIGMELSYVPAGSFMMGSTSAQVDEAWAECREYSSSCERSWFSHETPQRLVTIRQGFWMGRHEVTQGQYEAVMGTNPSVFKNCGKDCPVEEVSWNDAKEFIKRLNDRNDGFVYSLPTEAEWEYAARAGTTTAFAFGNSLSSTQANFNGNYPYGNAANGPDLGRTAKVGSYRPNAWGLYDMHGNVWEWVEDIYQDSYTGLPTDGSENTTRGDSQNRVLRGGSWNYFGYSSRSADRFRDLPTRRYYSFGFRVVARSR